MGEEEEEEVVEFVWTELDVLLLERVLFFLLEKIFMLMVRGFVNIEVVGGGIEMEEGYSFAKSEKGFFPVSLNNDKKS